VFLKFFSFLFIHPFISFILFFCLVSFSFFALLTFPNGVSFPFFQLSLLRLILMNYYVFPDSLRALPVSRAAPTGVIFRSVNGRPVLSLGVPPGASGLR
jgi:hypothetical protein